MIDEQWFSKRLSGGVSAIFKNSFVQSFVDADQYYTDLRKEVEATKEGDLICWIGFDACIFTGPTTVNWDTRMPASSNIESVKKFPPRKPETDDKLWFELLKKASNDRNVKIRVLLNLHPSPSPHNSYKRGNFDLVEKLNTLINCAAINDFRYLFMNGTHHQKLVLVYNSKKGLIAYIGTCDVAPDRINEKWCEVQCKVTGDATVELYKVFHERWSEHSEVFKRIGSLNSYLPNVNHLKTAARKSGNFMIQIATTFGNPKRETPFIFRSLLNPSHQVLNKPHRLRFPPYSLTYTTIGNDFFREIDPLAPPLLREAEKQRDTYSFAPNGQMGIYHMIKAAIEKTQKYIYIEDQYLVCDIPMGKYKPILESLINKLKSTEFKKLIIFCNRIDDINKEFHGTAWKHRNNFISSLISAAKSKVEVCQYKTKGSVGCPGEAWRGIFYIHSKTWVFDDEYLITGSANCNRRGYSHDSELDIGIYDQNKMFVKKLRMIIWKTRLNVEGIGRSPIQDKELNDFLSASKFWENPNRYMLPIENSKKKSFAPIQNPDLNIQSFKAKINSQGMPQISSLIINDLLNKIKMDELWDLAVDPDGA